MESPANFYRKEVALPLTNDEMFRLVEIFKTTLAFPYRVTIERVTSIPRNKNAKFEDFICEIK